MAANPEILKQHLIDPEVCIRCNTCEETCPVDAITHDDNNYVVDPAKCNFCMACISPCPTGSIDNWRMVAKPRPYTVDEQFTWDELPPEQAVDGSSDAPMLHPIDPVDAADDEEALERDPAQLADPRSGSQIPPWSASHPYVNLYGHKSPVTATVAGNFRVTQLGTESDTHHIVLDFGGTPFPVLEGQSIGILPPGADARGRAHHARQYSIASPRDGERPGYNNVSLTVKRVTADHAGNPVRGVASNYVCDLKKGDEVRVIGPFGTSFLMPNHPGSNLIMVCTGTGSAPMRAMTERRRRRVGLKEGGRLMLFFGARTQKELPYFGPLMNLSKDFIDINFAFSREAGAAEGAKRYVQHLMVERADDVAALLRDENTYLYVCGLKGMEAGVLDALRAICGAQAIDWPALHAQMKRDGRLHFETY
jgi:benzoyl-CoA oxygenase/reductase BoxA protein